MPGPDVCAEGRVQARRCSALPRRPLHGIRLGQVALVIYNGRMQFGIFGDAGPSSVIGEASYAMAQALGIPSSPISGGVDSGVTYLVFTDPTARVAHNESNAEAVSIGQPLLNTFVGP